MPKDFVGVAGEKGTLPSWKAVKAAQRVLDLPVAERRVYVALETTFANEAFNDIIKKRLDEELEAAE